MFMSIFSSFDALCAESVGRKVSLSDFAPPPSNAIERVPGGGGSVKIDDLKKGKEANSSSQPEKKAEDRRRMRALRFAPEFDGVYSFETIVGY
ncbi:hypothetical protein CDL12_29117 [Handroanthus impetiginosus]|uniref:Uncharacterized protein n=1 Tax=Handroanthus impetiginosus TaxID=429701 RepID=A0A2G9FZB2_9LAMI|nr:hypothetical protein CDL12_29117 [Handroanthus impetiginosus]